MTTNKRNWSADDVQEAIEQIISCERGLEVTEVEPFEEYFTVKFNNDIDLSTVNEIASKVGSKYITIGAEDDYPTLFFQPGRSDDESWDDDDYDEPESEEEDRPTPRIPNDMRHTDRFPDSEDVIIPGTEVKRSRTEGNEQVVAWMKKTGHYPIVYIRLDGGVHVEVSDIYDQKVRDVLERGEAVGGDGRKYKIENPDNIFPIGDSICVRATCIETGRGDVYGLDFFV